MYTTERSRSTAMDGGGGKLRMMEMATNSKIFILGT